MGLCGRKAMGPKLKLLEAYDMRWVVQRRLSLGWDGAAEGNAAPVGEGVSNQIYACLTKLIAPLCSPQSLERAGGSEPRYIA